jgi:hypothetical protein
VGAKEKERKKGTSLVVTPKRFIHNGFIHKSRKMKSSSLKWLKNKQTVIIRLLIVLLFFIIPFSKGIPLSILPPEPMLKVAVVPPGYPVEGTPWNIKIWGSTDGGLKWYPLKNATIEINTSNQGDFVLYSDDQGTASFTYTKSLGSITVKATSEKYGIDEWVPQISFISNQIALVVISLFGLGMPSAVWQVLSKLKRKDVIDKILFYVLLVFSVIGWVLSLLWFWAWKFGSEWGFGNRIITLFYPVYFDPHLIVIVLIVLASGLLSTLKLLFARRSARATEKATYVV